MRNQTTSMLSLFFLTNIHLCCWENKHATPQNKKNKKQGRSMIGLNGPTIDWSKNCSNKKKNPLWMEHQAHLDQVRFFDFWMIWLIFKCF